MSDAFAPPSTSVAPQSNPELFYEHSGRPGMAFPLALFLGIPASILLAAVYSYVVVYCPVVGYVNVLFLGAFVFGGGWVLGRIAHLGKCRSPMAMGIIGMVCGLVALYFAWIFFVKALVGGDAGVMDLILNPILFAQVVASINAEGWWGPSGIAQWALVAVEAAVVVGGFTLAGFGAIGEGVFCEDCNSWCKPFEVMHLKKDAEAIAMNGEPSSVLDLLKLEETTATDYPRYEGHVLQCGSCSSMQAIRFYHVAQIMDDGELKEQRDEVPGVLVQKA